MKIGLAIATAKTELSGSCPPPQSPAVPAPLILVDDIYTSGATISAAQAALSQAGYRVAAVLVVAIAQSDRESLEM
ncbi:MAG: hypothetical protein HC926_04660 [Synechococcaceae cyanobacterium SM2_3_60]|nr:hypothetical protein [Synechococcaceae cyanobacterium SM2_3_60]